MAQRLPNACNQLSPALQRVVQRFPSNLTAQVVELGVLLNWDAPTQKASSVIGYEILRRRPFSEEDTLLPLVSDTESTSTSYTDTTATEPGVRYTYRVKALRGSEKSRWSNYAYADVPQGQTSEPAPTSNPEPTATPTPEPNPVDLAPGNLSAQAVDYVVLLSWDAPATDATTVTGYRVLRAKGEGQMTVLADVTGSDDRTYTDATATVPGEIYSYAVQALRGTTASIQSNTVFYGSGWVFSQPAPSEPAPLPAAPTQLSASSGSEGVVLTWHAPDDDSVTGYQLLRRCPRCQGEQTLVDTGGTATSFTDTDVHHGVQYEYGVKAINANGVGTHSNLASIVYDDPAILTPDAPTSLAVRRDNQSIVLTWDTPDDDSITGYQILRRTPAECEPELVVYVENTNSTDTTFTDTDVVEGLQYIYGVRAINEHGIGPLSNFGTLHYVTASPHAGAPSPPRNLDVAATRGGIELAWDTPNDDSSITGYQVLRRRPEQCETAFRVHVEDTESTSMTFVDTEVENGVLYEYRLKAINESGVSAQSAGTTVPSARMHEARIVVLVLRSSSKLMWGEIDRITLAFNHLPQDADPDTLDFMLRGDVVRNVDGEEVEAADACVGEGLGVDQQLYVVDERVETLYAYFPGYGSCEVGQYTINFVLSDREGTTVWSTAIHYELTNELPSWLIPID